MKNNELLFLENLFDQLWPINRSILGEGYDESMALLQKYLPLDEITYRTGDQIFDWTVPKGWKISSGTITDPNGKVVVDYKSNNLHVVSHSEAVDRWISKEELKKNIFTLPDQPSAIPYVTNYYGNDWGFCLTHQQLEKLDFDEYHVQIDSKKYDANLTIGELIMGEPNEPFICFSSYLCHPSLANNELSGPVLLTGLYRRLAKRKLNKSIRFYLFPETIGSICLLHARGNLFKKHLIAGFHLTCIGDSKPFTLKFPRNNALATNKIVEDHFQNIETRYVSFNPAYGSDDRQFCSPGFDLPYYGVSRSIYTEYPEYHTSLDNKILMDFEKMVSTIDILEKLILKIDQLPRSDFQKFMRVNPFGEPQLSKRNMFRGFSTKLRNETEEAMWWILNYSDGKNTIADISMRSEISKETLHRTAVELLNANLVYKI